MQYLCVYFTFQVPHVPGYLYRNITVYRRTVLDENEKRAGGSGKLISQAHPFQVQVPSAQFPCT